MVNCIFITEKYVLKMVYWFREFFSKYIIYTKILQWFSFNSYFSFIIRNFTDSAPYIDSDIDLETIETIQTNANNNGYQLSVDKIPINSGTLALVFKGQLSKENVKQAIVLKVLRTNIRAKIQSALQNITMFCDLFSFIPFLCKLNLIGIVNDMKTDLLEQTDFSKEIESIKHVYKCTKTHKRINPTNTIDFICNENCIAMSYINGINILRMSREKKKLFIEPTVMAFVHMTFKKMIFHLDLHPGNILFDEDGYKVCFLDMGMIIKLTVQENNFLYDLIQIMYDKFNEDEAVSMFLKHKETITSSNIDIELLLRNIFKKYPNLFHDKRIKTMTLDVGKLLYELDTSKNKLNPTINKLLVGFMSFLGICDILDEDGIFRTTLLDVIKKI